MLARGSRGTLGAIFLHPSYLYILLHGAVAKAHKTKASRQKRADESGQ